QIVLRGRHAAGDADPAAGLGHAPAHRVLGRLGFDQRGARVLVEVAAGVGQHEAARGAVDQAHAEFVLERGHALADRGLGHAEPARGRGETAAVHRGGEQDQVVEVQHAGKVHICRL
ncbi:hypothetical protein CATMIT_01822, partial [Catenibacterium mitsuokai DSM 15897]